MFEAFKDAIKLLLAVGIPAFLVLFLIYKCTYANHTVTEENPTPNLELTDINYKGHTYIYVSGTYSHTIVHAEHCKCHSVKK